MKAITLYLLMSVMDAFFIGGCAWLVGWRGWNPWWFALAFLLATGTNPVRFLR